ncbi:hypothetical protein ACH5RR_012165 [Cinchona calisaya]|uniref:ZF-HD dimerization-type domain-containing protein n=1 Tax=Cinchona calisaya TaxID=153742 RepID=A0ABD3A8H8_9GENT
MGPSYDSLPNSNSTRLTKIPSPVEMSAEPTSQRKPRYRECLKNHAVGIGGHAVDGCGEFLPAGAEGTLDALKCAACNCHRNFHRKEAFPGAAPHDPFHFLHHHHHHYQQRPPPQLLTYRTPSGYVHVSPPLQPRPLALPSTSSRGDQQEDTSKKRHRTKFSQEQKEKMLELAEKLGWKMQKQDEEIVQQFCNESGIKRNVFKVWMHNNKTTLGKQP